MAAVQIGVVLENATLYAKLEESYRHITRAKKEIEVYSGALDLEMKKERKIQQDFLPEQIPEIPGWEIEAFLHPATQVSGDFYKVLQAINDTNSYMARHHGKLGMFATMFATMFAGVLNLSTEDLTYINAGHEPPLILSATGEIMMLPPTCPAVGLLPELNFISIKVHIIPGDILIAYTDGVTEANSPENKILGRKRLHSALQKRFSSALETVEHIKRETFTHIGSAPQNDDITLLCVRRKNLTLKCHF